MYIKRNVYEADIELFFRCAVCKSDLEAFDNCGITYIKPCITCLDEEYEAGKDSNARYSEYAPSDTITLSDDTAKIEVSICPEKAKRES